MYKPDCVSVNTGNTTAICLFVCTEEYSRVMVIRFTTDTYSPRCVSITIERTLDRGHARAASVLKLARLWTTRFDPWRAVEYPFCLDSLSIRERFRFPEFQVFFFPSRTTRQMRMSSGYRRSIFAAAPVIRSALTSRGHDARAHVCVCMCICMCVRACVRALSSAVSVASLCIVRYFFNSEN